MANENTHNDNSPSDRRFKELTHGYYYSLRKKSPDQVPHYNEPASNEMNKQQRKSATLSSTPVPEPASTVPSFHCWQSQKSPSRHRSSTGPDDSKSLTGEKEKKHIRMDIPLECSYQKTNFQGQHQEKISHDHGSDWKDKDEEHISLLREDRTNEDGDGNCAGEEILVQAQKWGITLTQIRAIMKNIERRCVEEKWEKGDTALTPETVTMYDVKEKIIMPFTNKSRKSFVQTLPSTKGPQLPRHYLSYTWATPFKDIVLMLEQFVEDFSRNHNSITDAQGGGMTDETPIHISVFAINQYDLDRAGGFLPFSEFSSGIAQILKLVNYRIITHLDQEGRIFERVWPIYDIFVTLMKSEGVGMWKLYITHEDDDGNERNAVGLVPGGAPSDKYSIDTVLREKNFPIELIERFIEYEVKNVKAKNDNDRKNFLNFLADGNTDNLDKDPPTEHSIYTDFQDAFRANFATPGTLQASLSRGDKHWEQMLSVMSKSSASISLRFNFESGNGWDELTNSQAKELIHNLPKTTLRLDIYYASYGTSFVKELSDWIKETTNLKTLRIEDSLINCGIIDGQHKVIKELAESLACCKNLQRLEVWNSKVEENSIFVEMVKTLSSNENVAEALFIKPFKTLYEYPDFNKIKSLQTVFVSTERRVVDLPKEIKRATIDWAQDLPKSDKAELFQSRAGPFLKTILNEKFSDRLNLSYIILNLIVQVVIVILLSYYTTVETVNRIPDTIIVGLIFCIVWLCIIDMTQISILTVKEYISEEQNWVDFAQIVLLTKITVVPDLGGDFYWLGCAILVSYLSLIFSLGNVSFPLAQFVDAMIEITKALCPFMFTTVLIVLAFTHVFRVRYSEEICPIDVKEIEDSEELSFISKWVTCNSLFRSFKTMFFMFLTDGSWYFDDVRSEGLMALFAFVIGILLLNIVIAVVSNKFTDVQNDAEKVFWVRRLSLIKEVDSLRKFLRNFLKKLGCYKSIRGQKEKLSNKRKKNRFSFNLFPSDDDYADKEDIKLFFWWWFSPAGWGQAPPLRVRIYIFYSYSNWEDIVLPGKVFERILLSCKYNQDPEGNTIIVYFAKYFLVKLLTWVALFIHGILILAVFIIGFASFGLLWPRSLTEGLFHEGVDKESESNSKDTKHFIEELNTKVDALTAFVNEREDERSSVSMEENNGVKDYEKINTIVEKLIAKKIETEEKNRANDFEKLNTKIDKLTTLIENL